MALEFDQSVDAQTAESENSVSPPATTATISIWMQMTDLTPTLQRILGSAGDWEFRIANTGIITNDLYNPTSGHVSSTALAAGTWYHVVCTGLESAGTSTTEIYINGVFEGTTDVASSTVAAAFLTLAHRTGASAQEANVIMDDLRVYNRVLTAAEVETIYACRGTDNILEGLILRLQFEEDFPGQQASGTGAIRDVSHDSPWGGFTPLSAGSDAAYADGVVRSRRKTA